SPNIGAGPSTRGWRAIWREGKTRHCGVKWREVVIVRFGPARCRREHRLPSPTTRSWCRVEARDGRRRGCGNRCRDGRQRRWSYDQVAKLRVALQRLERAHLRAASSDVACVTEQAFLQCSPDPFRGSFDRVRLAEFVLVDEVPDVNWRQR